MISPLWQVKVRVEGTEAIIFKGAQELCKRFASQSVGKPLTMASADGKLINIGSIIEAWAEEEV